MWKFNVLLSPLQHNQGLTPIDLIDVDFGEHVYACKNVATSFKSKYDCLAISRKLLMKIGTAVVRMFNTIYQLLGFDDF